MRAESADSLCSHTGMSATCASMCTFICEHVLHKRGLFEDRDMMLRACAFLLGSMAAETRETLGIRAGYAARCILALNQQVDLLLSALPADEGDEDSLDAILQDLSKENVEMGELLQSVYLKRKHA